RFSKPCVSTGPRQVGGRQPWFAGVAFTIGKIKKGTIMKSAIAITRATGREGRLTRDQHIRHRRRGQRCPASEERDNMSPSMDFHDDQRLPDEAIAQITSDTHPGESMSPAR